MLRFVGWLAYLWWKWWIKPPLLWYWRQNERALPHVKRFFDKMEGPTYTYPTIQEWDNARRPRGKRFTDRLITSRSLSAEEYDELVRRFRERHS